MKTRNHKLFWCCLLVCVNVLFIWGNSILPAEESSRFSQSVMEVLEKLSQLPVLDKITALLCSLLGFVDITDPDGLTAGGLLRKIAHFSEFFCLGMSLFWLFQILEQRGIYRFAMPQFCGILVAFIDETIQLFSPGRAGSVVDMWIDTAGVFAGIVLFLSIDQLISKKKKTKTK